MSAPVDVVVPETFWLDHLDRMPYDDERDCPQTVQRVSNHRVVIRGTDAGLRVLLADAEYCADPNNMDDCPRHIRESAKRMVAAIRAREAKP